MNRILIKLLLCIFCGSNLFAGDYEIGSEFYKKGEYLKASELFTKACNDENTKSCLSLGVMYNHGFGVKEDYQKAIELYKKACDGGYGRGCVFLGSSYYDKAKEGNQDVKKAKELFGRACDLGDQTGCENYAFLNKE